MWYNRTAMSIPESFYKEEIRWDHTITEKTKKVWAIELGILEQIDAICTANNLSYFAEYGTLLGAIRHHGFIPWDDDIDISMPRDDFMRFKEIARKELKAPYFLQDAYSSPERFYIFAKIRHSESTAIEFYDCLGKNYNQGIFLDIFPLDDVPDSANAAQPIRAMEFDLWSVIANPELVAEAIAQGRKSVVPDDILLDFIEMPRVEQFRTLEGFFASHYGQSDLINTLTADFIKNREKRKREWYREAIRVPFEHTTIPVPVGYEKVLVELYGEDYMTPKKGLSAHEGIFFDPDNPYTIYGPEAFPEKFN